MSVQGQTSAYLDAPADAVFAAVTDLAALPQWNERMTGVVELPERLEPGAEWAVGFRLMGSRFTSRSTVLELDRDRRRFVHRSRREGSPSYSLWSWTVQPEGAGARVTLRWELRPQTWLHRRVIAPLRGRQIAAQDGAASLAALGRLVQARSRIGQA